MSGNINKVLLILYLKNLYQLVGADGGFYFKDATAG